MKLNVLIFGASGMVGKGALLECLESNDVNSVLVIGRSTCGNSHSKLTEIIHTDMFDINPLKEKFASINTCFFCLGVSAMGLSEEKYTRLTYDLTLKTAQTLLDINKGMTFIYVSGAGTDRTEKGKTMWARVKGKTENALLKLPFKATYMFRPGYIQPLRGVKTKVALYRYIYYAFGWLYPLWKLLFGKHILTTVDIGQAMITLNISNKKSGIYESSDINELST